MSDIITVTGVVATPPKEMTVGDNLRITSFRLASGQRRFDKGRNQWVDGDTNWYTITTFRHLAVNVAGSLIKGDRVVATGRLRIRDWESGGKTGTNIDIEADAVGHDLTWGTTRFTRVPITASAQTPAAEQPVPDTDFPSESASEWGAPGLALADSAGDPGEEPGDRDLQPSFSAAEPTPF
jgi:single-strand DNA-binding protein